MVPKPSGAGGDVGLERNQSFAHEAADRVEELFERIGIKCHSALVISATNRLFHARLAFLPTMQDACAVDPGLLEWAH